MALITKSGFLKTFKAKNKNKKAPKAPKQQKPQYVTVENTIRDCYPGSLTFHVKKTSKYDTNNNMNYYLWSDSIVLSTVLRFVCSPLPLPSQQSNEEDTTTTLIL